MKRYVQPRSYGPGSAGLVLVLAWAVSLATAMLLFP